MEEIYIPWEKKMFAGKIFTCNGNMRHAVTENGF